MDEEPSKPSKIDKIGDCTIVSSNDESFILNNESPGRQINGEVSSEAHEDTDTDFEDDPIVYHHETYSDPLPLHSDHDSTSEKKSKQKPLSVKIMTPEDLRKQMNSKTLALTEVFDIKPNKARIFLGKCKWDFTGVMDRFSAGEADVTTLMKNVADTSNFVMKPSTSNGDVCVICQEFGQLIALQCAHWACEECWMAYINGRVQDGRVNIECMWRGCSGQVEEHSLLAYLDLSMIPAYHRGVLNNFVEANDNLRWCPGADCKNAIKTTSTVPHLAICSCGCRFCSSCAEEPHEPIDCRTLRRWARLCEEEANRKAAVEQQAREDTHRAAVPSEDPLENQDHLWGAQGDFPVQFCLRCSNQMDPNGVRGGTMCEACNQHFMRKRIRIHNPDTPNHDSPLPQQHQSTLPSAGAENQMDDWHKMLIRLDAASANLKDRLNRDRLHHQNYSQRVYGADEGPNVVKTCPHCHFYVWKDGGCDLMTCKICKHQFYWFDVKEIGQSSPPAAATNNLTFAAQSPVNLNQAQLHEHLEAFMQDQAAEGRLSGRERLEQWRQKRVAVPFSAPMMRYNSPVEQNGQSTSTAPPPVAEQEENPQERNFQFYHQRYMALKETLAGEDELQNQVDASIGVAAQIYKKSPHTFNFLHQARQILSNSRRSLMFTYPLSSFLDHSDSGTMLLDHNQEELETAIEELAGLLNQALEAADPSELREQIEVRMEYVGHMTKAMLERVKEGYEKNIWKMGE